MRTFLAVELNDSVRQHIAALSARLQRSRAKVSWTKIENTHITLRFLGDITDDQAVEIGDVLAPACANLAPFTLTIGGVGAFPNARRPRVIWVGANPGDGPVQQAHEIAEAAARAIGLEPDPHTFTPHITVARIRDSRQPGDLSARIGSEQAFHAGDIEVARVVLFKSTLSPHGAQYTVIREFPFSCSTSSEPHTTC